MENGSAVSCVSIRHTIPRRTSARSELQDGDLGVFHAVEAASKGSRSGAGEMHQSNACVSVGASRSSVVGVIITMAKQSTCRRCIRKGRH